MDDAPTTPAEWAGDGHEGIGVLEHICADDQPGLRRADHAGERGQKLAGPKSPPNVSAATPSAPRRASGDLRVAEVDRRREARCHLPAEGAELRDEGRFLLPPDGRRVGDDCGAAPSQFAVRIAPEPRHVLSFVGVEAIDVRGGVPQGELLRHPTRPV